MASSRQTKVLLLLQRCDKQRELYEARDGRYYLTYSAGESYEPLRKDEVLELVRRGLVAERWPGCYALP